MGILTLHGDAAKKEFVISNSRPVFIGRVADSEICLPSPAVSRQHAVLIERNGVCGIKDLGSVNGTYVNGTRIQNSIRLVNGDIIQIAEFIFEFAASDAASTVIFEPGLMPSLRQPAGHAPGIPKPDATVDAAVVSAARPPAAEPQPATGPAPKSKSKTQPEPDPKPEPQSKFVFGAKPEPTAEPEPASSEPELGSEPKPVSDAASQSESNEDAFLTDDSGADDDDGDDLNPESPKTVGAGYAAKSGQPSDDDTPEALPTNEDIAEKRDAALNKAAAEAGLVGEFAPDVEEDPPAGAAEEEHKAERLPLSRELRNLIEARLSLYSSLDRLANARQEMLARHPQMPEGVKSELARQDREITKMPTAEQAKTMREKRIARRIDLEEKRKKAAETGETPPPKPSKLMLEAENLAASQWSLIAKSEEGALPPLLEKARELCRDEPLMKDLSASGIDAGFMMGGGIYYLALESLLEAAQNERKAVRAKLSSAAPEKKGEGFRLFGKRASDEGDEDDEEAEKPRIDPERLKEEEQALAARIAGIAQELADLEKKLIREFWAVYPKAALAHIPEFDSMPWSIRAFLRHGAVGHAPWWLPEEIRGHVYRDCNGDIRPSLDCSAEATHIMYADEYIRAVANHACTPALDENLELNERNSPNWKADKALRKLIFSRSQLALLDGLLGKIKEKVGRLEGEHDQLAEQVGRILRGAKNEKQQKRELQQKQQAMKVEMNKLNKLSEKIRTQTILQMREAVVDTEKRFDDGELPRPPTRFIIERECDAVHKIARLLANLKERFMPLVVRDYKPGTDALNDRTSVSAEVADIERRDPAVFLETLVPSKRKKDRVDLRISPGIVILPAAGILCYSWNPRGGPENGRLAIPSCFIRQRLRERQLTYLFADFRWDTSKAAAGMDLMTSDTIVAAFMTVRWDWRKRSREAREKGLIFNDQNDRTNWRRVYEAYIQTAMDSGKKLYNRNYDFYERVIGKYFDLPEGQTLLKK